MGQISPYLRRAESGHTHWCPGCENAHMIPDTWTFNGNVDKPTFSPSVRITYNGPDAGQARENERRAPAKCCHYFLTDGQLSFCGDSTHKLAGQAVALPELPEWMQDGANLKFSDGE